MEPAGCQVLFPAGAACAAGKPFPAVAPANPLRASSTGVLIPGSRWPYWPGLRPRASDAAAHQTHRQQGIGWGFSAPPPPLTPPAAPPKGPGNEETTKEGAMKRMGKARVA